jgi:PAS domain S-box-containing protein
MARILVVDDEKIVRDLLKEALEDDGHEICTAENAVETITLLDEHDFDVAILDINLPGLSGMVLLEEVSKSSPRTRVIMMTGDPTLETAAQSVKSGAFDYLIKPFNMKEVSNSISRALEQKRLSDKSNQLFDEKIIESENKYRALFGASVDAIEILDENGNILNCNDLQLELLGYSRQDVLGKHVTAFFTKEQAKIFKEKFSFLKETGRVEGELEMVREDGSVVWVWRKAAAIYDEAGDFKGAIAYNRDISENKRDYELQRIRITLLEYSVNHTLGETIQKTLDETCEFFDSPIGFYHFVEPDQKTLNLQMWSTRTVNEFCVAEGKGMHYPIDQAGVWVDCVREKRAVIHNDYSALPHKKGLPEGHATVIRELVVPVMRAGLIVAILGVGNKPAAYTETDARLMTILADTAWEAVERKRAEEALRELNDIVEASPAVVFLWRNEEGWPVANVSENVIKLSGYTAEDFLTGRMSYKLVVHPDDQERVVKEIFIQAAEEDQTHLEHQPYRIVTSDGSVKWVNAHTVIRRDKTGKVSHYQGIVIDITERKQAEEALRELNNIVEASPAVAFLWRNEKGYPVGNVSKNVIKLFGLTAEDFRTGRVSYEGVIHPDDLKRVENEMATFDTKEGQTRLEHLPYRIITGDGSVKWVTDHTVICRDKTGKVSHYQGIVIDITERMKAEEQLRLMGKALETTQVGITIADIEGKILYTNPAEARMHGYTQEELTGKDIGVFAPADTRDKIASAQIREMKQWSRESVNMRKNGEQFPVYLRSDVATDEQGELIGIVTTCEDITEKIQAEEKVKRAYADLDQIFQTAAVGMRVVDKYFNVVLANDTLTNLIGIPKEQIIGQQCHEILPGEFCHTDNCTMVRILKGEEVKATRIVKKRADGQKFHCLFNARPLKDTKGNIVGIIENFTDINELKELEAIIEAANLMDNIGFIFSGVRHEIGNPVNSIKMAATVLADNIDDFSSEQFATYFDRILSETNRIESLLRALKNFSMFETPEVRKVNLSAFLNVFLTLVAEDYEKKGVMIENKLSSDPKWAAVDPRALQHVMLNLLANSFDALDGIDNPVITISLAEEENRFMLYISDNGCGISKKQRKNIFKPFCTTKEKGSGLGLVIVKKMLTAMHCNIEVTSVKGVSTTMVVSIPEAGDDN